jgi:hypothetical protein
MRINWKKERAIYDATIKAELDKLGVSNPESLKQLPELILETLVQEFKEKRNKCTYGGSYQAYDYLESICSSRLPLFNGGDNE